MTDDQKSKVAKLRAAIAASGPAKGGAPREVRTAALVLKEELRQVGTAARVLAAALGVHEATLCRWQQEAGGTERLPPMSTPRSRGRGTSFRVVQVTDSKPSLVASMSAPALAPASVPTAPCLRVAHTPSGLVIDGLDVESLAALLRRMS